MPRAIFFDRDGTLIRHVDHLRDPAQVELAPGAATALRVLKAAGFLTVVVTNQPAIARGLATRQEVDAVNARLQQLVGPSAALDRFCVCPHDDRDRCACRKPQPGLLVQAATDLGIALTESFLVGDRTKDIVAGHRAGCRSILVSSGVTGQAGDGADTKPDFTVASLEGAATLILGARS
jgi:histidinol-phosphate phosphatase family protein